MGWFDIDNKWFFGGMFDFNRDGKTSWSEQFVAHKMFEECAKELDVDDDYLFDSDFYDDLNLDSDTYDRNEWRLRCDDGSDCEVDPEDYETEEEYSKALEEARSKSETTVSVPVSIEISFPALNKKEEIKEEDYPNKRQYNAACALARTFIYCDEECEREKKALCNFILNKSSELIAARYLTASGDFLYAQAVKDNFDLPITLPDEDEKREYFFRDILKKLARKDMSLCFEVWSWCLDNFLKYSEYDVFSEETLTNRIIDDLYDFPDEFEPALVKYLSSHPDFRKTVIREAAEVSDKLSELVVEAIKLNLQDTAKLIFEDGLAKADGKWKPINKLMSNTIFFAKNYDELETIEYIEENLLPLVKAYPDGMIADEIETWERDISEYKLDVEKRCDKYAYTRGNAWRNAVPNGDAYGVDPLCYDSESEYLKAYNEAKYRWRRRYSGRNTYGLNPDSYETEAEFRKALSFLTEGKDRKVFEGGNTKETKAVNVSQSDDKAVYTYCGVLLSFSSRPYFFRTDKDDIEIGDRVFVQVGSDNEEAEGVVVSIGKYLRIAVPFPVEKTKFIIGKFED